MSRLLMLILITCLILPLAGVVNPAQAAKKDTTNAAAKSHPANLEAKTIFVDISALSRRKGMAKGLTEKHQEYAQLGWEFADLEIYIENGDLEGFFVTYVRPRNRSKTAVSD